MKLAKQWVIGLVGAALTILPAAVARPAAAQGQDTFTPMALDAGFGHMDVTPPATPPEEIVKKFAARETEFQEALNHYTYRRVARVQTIDDDNKVDGEWYQVDDVIFTPDGRRTEKTVYAPESTLQRVIMTPSDMQDIQHGYPFVLTTEEIPAYDIKYVGRQKVDEIDCYVFDVSPKQIAKNHRYLLGRIWVDVTDLQIVVTNGRMVPDGTKKGDEDLHPPFMTWRAQIDGHYWFPVYTKGEGVLHFSGGHGYMAEDVHMRDVIKYTDYKRFGSTSTIIYNGQEVKSEQPNSPNPPQQPKQPK
ncbi:MAG TPA: hypothetical protein VG225_00305 [Terracidiphilus sp.]|jgi:hypothetical protein|nr:hypothetical protein [Terracidiphilus sp.]